MNDMEPKDAIKLDIVQIDKPETLPEENVLPEYSLCRYLYQSRKQHGDKRKGLLTLSGVKLHIDKLQKSQAIGCYPKSGPDKSSVRDELMHIPEDTQVPLSE